jgi:pimeloyl-ACP methyl ester carboxylesterase
MNDARTVKLSNGTTIGYAEYGAPDGMPLIALHGMPNTHLMWKSIHQDAIECGIRVIAPDRAGYGLSNAHVPRTLLDYPDEVAALADALDMERFVILGASGGGPYAYACAYKLTNRLTAAMIVSSIAPLKLLNATREMDRMNRLIFNLGRVSPFITSVVLTALLKSSLPAMRQYIQSGRSPSPDLSPENYALIAQDLAEVVRTGRRGIASDLKIYWRDWGFRLEDIATEVYLWHGGADKLAPVECAQYIAAHLPNRHAHYFPDEGHVEPLIKHTHEILDKVNTLALSV